MPLADAEAVDLLDLAVPDEKLAQDVALAVSLGGDGTMLRTVDLVEEAEVPVLGVNVGLLGYLTEVEPNAMTSALERFFAGDYGIEDRMMLSVTIRSKRSLLDGWSFRALNEAVVEKTQVGPHRADARAHRRRGLHVLRGRRPHRRDADRFDGVLALGPRPDRVAPSSRAAAHAGLAAHALRPLARSSIPARRSASR